MVSCRGNKRCLIETIPEVSLPFFRNNRGCLCSFSTAIGTQIQPSRFEHLPMVLEAVGIAKGSEHLR